MRAPHLHPLMNKVKGKLRGSPLPPLWGQRKERRGYALQGETRRKVAERQAHISGPVTCQKPGRAKTGNSRSQIQKKNATISYSSILSLCCALESKVLLLGGWGGGVFLGELGPCDPLSNQRPPHQQKEVFIQPRAPTGHGPGTL